MGKVCIKCGYERKPKELAPDYECPRCGVIYAKAEAAASARTDAAAPPVEPMELDLAPRKSLIRRPLRLLVIACVAVTLFVVLLERARQNDESLQRERRLLETRLVEALSPITVDATSGSPLPVKLPGKLVIFSEQEGVLRLSELHFKLPRELQAMKPEEVGTIVKVTSLGQTLGHYGAQIVLASSDYDVPNPLPYTPQRFAKGLRIKTQVSVVHKESRRLLTQTVIMYEPPKELHRKEGKGMVGEPRDENGREVEPAEKIIYRQVMNWLMKLPREH